jgi:hypothetical protein
MVNEKTSLVGAEFLPLETLPNLPDQGAVA